jgi:hypothetical protein
VTFVRRLVLAAIAVGCAPTLALGQGSVNNDLSISATTITWPTVVEADFDAGFVDATGSITATVDATKASGPQAGVLRSSIVSIRATATTMGGGGKSVSDIQWRRSDLATWNSLSTTDATIESRQIRFTPALNDPWTTTVFFRALLSWATDAPGTNTATVVFTLTITTP